MFFFNFAFLQEYHIGDKKEKIARKGYFPIKIKIVLLSYFL